MNDINAVVGERASDFAVVVNAKPAWQQIFTIQADTEQPPRAELGTHDGDDLKKKA